MKLNLLIIGLFVLQLGASDIKKCCENYVTNLKKDYFNTCNNGCTKERLLDDCIKNGCRGYGLPKQSI